MIFFFFFIWNITKYYFHWIFLYDEEQIKLIICKINFSYDNVVKTDLIKLIKIYVKLKMKKY